MNTPSNKVNHFPPSLIKSFKAGFDAVANHIGIILFPLSIDAFLWFGPRLRLSRLIDQYLDTMQAMPGISTTDMASFLSSSQDLWREMGEKLNLFALVRTYPVGISSLMVSMQPIKSPLGTPGFWEVSSLGETFFLGFLVSLFGLVAGTLYFAVVAQATLAGNVDWRRLVGEWPWAYLQVVTLALVWVILILVVSIPSSCLITMLFMSGAVIGQIGALLIGGFLLWLIFPLLFSSHGIFVNRSIVWKSIKDSIFITRYTFPSTVLLFLAILFLSEVMSILWRAAGDASWFTWVGLAGHGFITSGLLATTFVYYRDASQWMQGLIQKVDLASLKS